MLKGVLKDLIRMLYGQNRHAFADGLGDIVDILRIFWYDDGVIPPSWRPAPSPVVPRWVEPGLSM